jgi:phosphoenolpyruvate phosphomutase
MSRATRKRSDLRAGISAARPVVAVGAHDALTARLIEQRPFDAVWVSGLGVSTAQLGVPDLNLMTFSEALEAAVRIDRATDLPVIADCDNGYGGMLNVLRTAREYELAGIAGICLEDNVFPKRNSLLGGDVDRELLPTAEHAHRIAAIKDRQDGPDFVVIARVEALIAGLGVDEAIDRALAYAAAGADAIVIHSRDKTLAEIDAFLERWRSVDPGVPLVAIPTLFPAFSADELAAKGFAMVIFANQPLRGAVRAMEQVLDALWDEGRAAAADPFIDPVDHVFDLVETREAIALDDAPRVAHQLAEIHLDRVGLHSVDECDLASSTASSRR